MTRIPLSEKNRTASDPINPEEPVIITVSNLFLNQVLIDCLTGEHRTISLPIHFLNISHNKIKK